MGLALGAAVGALGFGFTVHRYRQRVSESFLFQPHRPTSHIAGQRWKKCYYWEQGCDKNNDMKCLIVYFHANAETICESKDYLENLNLPLGCGFLAPEYPGYGPHDFNRRIPNVADGLEESLQLCQYILRQQVRPPSVIVIGRSLGAGFASWIANRLRDEFNVCGLILLCPFASVSRMAKEMVGCIGRIVVDRSLLNNARELRTLPSRIPVCIIHGDEDRIVPLEHSRYLTRQRENIDLIIGQGESHNSLTTSVWVQDFIVREIFS